MTPPDPPGDRPSGSRTRRMRRFWAGNTRATGVRTALASLCWVVAGGILLAEALRLLDLDTGRSSLIAMSTAWPLVVLPGILVVLGAAYLRRTALTAATVVVALIGLSAWWPCWIGEVGPGPKGAARMRVLALNIEYTQDTGAAASRQIRGV